MYNYVILGMCASLLVTKPQHTARNGKNECDAKKACSDLFRCVPSTHHQEARAAAVEKVSKASKARAQAQLPPTPLYDGLPPPPATASTLVSTVRGLAKRLSSSRLATLAHNVGSTKPTSTISSPVYSTLSSDSAGATDSEMGSLVEDNGSSSSSDSVSSSEDEQDESRYHGLRRRLVLRPMPSHVYREGRKVSDTSSIKSTVTVKPDGLPNTLSPSTDSDFDSTTSDRSVNRSTLAARRASVYGYNGSSLCNTSDSTNASRIKESISMSANGFLSRMWNVATKTQDKTADHLSSGHQKVPLVPPAISIAEPTEQCPHGHGASTFKRLVHSRSAVFRTGQTTLDI